jgi:hypothetical protein
MPKTMLGMLRIDMAKAFLIQKRKFWTRHPMSVNLISRPMTRLQTRRRERDISPFPGCPLVLVMNDWPLMKRRGVDSLLQLPVLNHGRGAVTRIKWFVYPAGTFKVQQKFQEFF